MTVNVVHGFPLGNGPLVPLGQWAMLTLEPIDDGIVQSPPEIKDFTVSANRNGITVFYDFEGVTHHWVISFEEGYPTFYKVSSPR